MSDAVTWALAWTAGVGLGAIFYGGLWWTVERGISSGHPALWFVGSLVLRTSIALAGFFVVSGGHADRLVLCLVGFVVAHLLVTRSTRLTRWTRQEGRHAP